MILELDGKIEIERNTVLGTYRGLLVLRTMLKKLDQTQGVFVTEALLKELAEVMPELPGLVALR